MSMTDLWGRLYLYGLLFLRVLGTLILFLFELLGLLYERSFRDRLCEVGGSVLVGHRFVGTYRAVVTYVVVR